eukprot:gene8742-11813_t
MGNATDRFNYESASTIEYDNPLGWTLSSGTKKEDKDPKEKVNIFTFPSKKTQSVDRLSAAQRHVQKLRTLKHPFVVNFLESIELEDSILLVSESCIPLDTWLKSVQDRPDSSITSQSQSIIQELYWGFKCILMALDFLHLKCQMVHGYLGFHAIFVTASGDWKLSAFDLAGNICNSNDFEFLYRNQSLLPKKYQSSERSKLDFSSLKALPYHIDIYSFGQCMNDAFNNLGIEIPQNLSKLIMSMTSADVKKRPSSNKLLSNPCFNTESIRLLESIGELNLKTPKEQMEVFNQIEPRVNELASSICVYKIVPCLIQTLQISVNDFANRDARETCRQSIQTSLNLLSSLASFQKVDSDVFNNKCMPVLLQLWAMTDRTVRTGLLQSLKQTATLISSQIVNRGVFDNIIQGFNDSNS